MSIQDIRGTVIRNNKPTQVDYRLISLPLYLVERLPDLVLSE